MKYRIGDERFLVDVKAGGDCWACEVIGWTDIVRHAVVGRLKSGRDVVICERCAKRIGAKRVVGEARA